MAESLDSIRERYRRDTEPEERLTAERQKLVDLLALRAAQLVDSKTVETFLVNPPFSGYDRAEMAKLVHEAIAKGMVVLPEGVKLTPIPGVPGFSMDMKRGIGVDFGRPGGDSSVAIKYRTSDLRGKDCKTIIVDELIDSEADALARKLAEDISLESDAAFLANFQPDPAKTHETVRIPTPEEAADLLRKLGTYPETGWAPILPMVEAENTEICGHCDGGVEWMACTCPPKAK